VLTAQALFIFVVSIYRLSKTCPPSAYQFSRGGVPRPSPARPAPGMPAPLAGPPPGGFAVGCKEIVAGQARRAAPALLESSSAVAAALCAVPVSGVCAKTAALAKRSMVEQANRMCALVYRDLPTFVITRSRGPAIFCPADGTSKPLRWNGSLRTGYILSRAGKHHQDTRMQSEGEKMPRSDSDNRLRLNRRQALLSASAGVAA